ncbi:hypothetical protein FN846DRAFT_950269 [Sphaerosporella brunnea]|uniref:Uncharacterized protein n=1 Tax=Sphaerosporella brunnea TaxID=1250544 RepID=A0A5J5EXD2_9PEZI|nr:hypothetical protein FN846DRAFT_950269 [Sphaerosporella brunnea]
MIAELPERLQLKINKDLPLANHISLFMVRHANGDVAATNLHYPKLGSVTITIAKNDTNEEDARQMQRLLGLCHGNVQQRYQDCVGFALKGLSFVIPFCKPKILKRLGSISPEVLDAVISKIESLDPYEWDSALKEGYQVNFRTVVRALSGKPATEGNGDLSIVNSARNKKVGLAEVVLGWLHFLKAALEDPQGLLDGGNDERFLKASAMSDRLHRSVIFDDLLNKTDESPEEMAKLRMDLGKLGSYSRGFQLLFHVLSEPCRAGASPLKIKCRLLASPGTIKVKTAGEGWYELLNQFALSGLSQVDLQLSKEYLISQWANREHKFVVPEAVTAAYHCEMQLLDHLKAQKIYQGIVGVSKDCCELCSVAMAKMSSQANGCSWYASRGQGRVYVGLLPRDRELALHLRATVDTMLWDVLVKLRNRNESPVCTTERALLPNEGHDILVGLFEDW